MRKLLALAVLIFAAVASLGTLLPTQPPVCTATPPAQAISAGYTKLVYCSTLSTTVGVVDVNATLNPWFLFYTTAFGFTVPAGSISSDGTGTTVTGGPNNNYIGLPSVAISNGASYTSGLSTYQGNTITGAFYAEVDMQYDSAVCLDAANSVPAFWLGSPTGLTTTPNGEFDEFDIIEWVNCGGKGTVHWWNNTGGGNQTNICANGSNNTLSISPGSVWNTYGGLFTDSITGGGTGSFNWYFNNTNVNSLTYSPAGLPNPVNGCTTGAYAVGDTQQWAFMITGGTGDPVKFRNLHIWQKP